jgi:DNA-binding response OmpR family regulator
MTEEQTIKKILIIDDDHDFREIIAIYLSEAGYAVFSASNGEEAKQQLQLISPDLIILDMIMPVLDGMAFLHWLQQVKKQKIPILALTGLYKSDIEAEALEFGANEVLGKPCLPNEILERIAKLLNV